MNIGAFVVERLGADPRQWRSLTSAAAQDSRRLAPTARNWWRSFMASRDLVPLGVIGLFVGGLALQLPALSESSALALSIFMLLIFVALLEGRGRSLAHDQLALLRCFPISERTFFVCYLTGLLRRTASVTACVATPTVLLIAVREGAVPLLGWAAAIVFSSSFVAFSLAALFVWSKGISANRPWMGGGCLFAGILLLLAVVAAPTVATGLGDNAAGGMYRAAWAFPPLWFSAFVDAANSRHGAGVLTFGGVALAGTLLAYVAMAHAWNARVVTRAAGKPTATASWRALAGRVRHLLPPEARVCATLFRAHLQRDADFRLRLLAGLPLSLGLLSLGVLDYLQVEGVSERLDAFMSVGLIHVAAVAVPLSWLDAARRSEAFRAAWIFAATPTHVGKVAFWTANVVVLLAFPYLMLAGIVLFIVLGGGWNAFGHAVNLVLVVNVVVNAAAAVTPRVPFSASPAKSREVSSRNLVRDLAGWSLAFLLLPALLSAANVRLWSAVCLAAALIAVVVPLRRMVVRKGEIRTFTGSFSTAVRLGLKPERDSA